MKRKVYNIIKYLGLFFFFLSWNLIIQKMTIDEVWNYGFVYNIYKGLVPYKDFNMVITPFYPMFFSIFFYIFGSGISSLHIGNSICLCAIYYLFSKLLNKNKYIPFFFLLFPLSVVFPSYNLFLFFFFLLIIYLEKYYFDKDYLIGLLISLVILTKQSVGIFFVIASIIIYYKDKSKLSKRLIGLITPLVIFLFYLLINNNLGEFLNLCLFGLFDFANKNSSYFNIYIVFSIILLIVICFSIRKHPKDKLYYYLLAFFTILIPLFDLYHFVLFFVAFLAVILIDKEIKLKLRVELFFKWLIVGVYFVSFFNNCKTTMYPNDVFNFSYRYFSREYVDYTKDITKLMDKYSDRKIIFLSDDAYYFKLVRDISIDYYDLINYGNWGYNGSRKLLNNIKSMKNDMVFFVDIGRSNRNTQIDQELLNYVISNGKEIESCWKYSVYILE